MCRCAAPTRSTPSVTGRKNGIELDIREGDLEDIAAGKVDFYTFSYYMSSTVGTHADQGRRRGAT